MPPCGRSIPPGQAVVFPARKGPFGGGALPGGTGCRTSPCWRSLGYLLATALLTRIPVAFRDAGRLEADFSGCRERIHRSFCHLPGAAARGPSKKYAWILTIRRLVTAVDRESGSEGCFNRGILAWIPFRISSWVFRLPSSWQNLFFCFMGCLMGTLIGVLPGIGPAAGVSILIPLTFGMDTTTALITMAGRLFRRHVRRLDHVHSRQRAG